MSERMPAVRGHTVSSNRRRAAPPSSHATNPLAGVQRALASSPAAQKLQALQRLANARTERSSLGTEPIEAAHLPAVPDPALGNRPLDHAAGQVEAPTKQLREHEKNCPCPLCINGHSQAEATAKSPQTVSPVPPVMQRVLRCKHCGKAKAEVQPDIDAGLGCPEHAFGHLGHEFEDDANEGAGTGGLEDLMMSSGGLGDLLPDQIDIWPGLARDLAKIWYSPAVRNSSAGEGEVMYCGKIAMAANQHGETEFDYGAHDNEKVPEALIAREDIRNLLANFLIDFMTASGQIAYIEAQDWYKSREWKILIDVNFYPDRPLESQGHRLHKDTDGRNLFVSLIFNNERPIPATEWTQDRAIPGDERLGELKQALPDKLVEKILLAKQMLKGMGKPGEDKFEGGVFKDPNAYLSWVDELVWHTSPFLNNRARLEPGFILRNFDNPETIYEAIVILSQQEGTFISGFINDSPESFSIKKWLEIYNEYFRLFDPDENPTRKQSAILGSNRIRLKNDIRTFDWSEQRGGAATGKADNLALDDVLEVPTMTQTRERSNSDPGTLAEVQQAAVGAPARTFIRTWVTVVRANENP